MLSADTGAIFPVIYIVWRHHRVIRHQGLPKLWEFLSDHMYWPGPLRRRSTRKLVFKRCEEAACAVVAVVVLMLLLSNAAAPPSLTGDKWFSMTNVQPRVQRPSTQHSSSVALSQQLAQACSKQLVHADDAQQPSVPQQATPTSLASAIMKAPSRSLMLLPHAAVCAAVPKQTQHVLLVEHQQTLVLRPTLLPPCCSPGLQHKPLTNA